VSHADAAGNTDGVGLAAINDHGIGAVRHLYALRRPLPPFSRNPVPPNVRVEIDVSIPGNNSVLTCHSESFLISNKILSLTLASSRAAEPQAKRKNRDHHEAHEVHEERELTTKGAKSCQSEVSETFVSFVIFVVRVYFSNNISMTNS
jgi:hypothetical protein